MKIIDSLIEREGDVILVDLAVMPDCGVPHIEVDFVLAPSDGRFDLTTAESEKLLFTEVPG